MIRLLQPPTFTLSLPSSGASANDEERSSNVGRGYTTPQSTPLLGSSRCIVSEPLFTSFIHTVCSLDLSLVPALGPQKVSPLLKVLPTSIVVFAFLFHEHFGCVTVYLTESDDPPLMLSQLATSQLIMLARRNQALCCVHKVSDVSIEV